MQQVTITFELKVQHSPNDQDHLKHVVLEWIRSKGGDVKDNIVRI